MKLLGKVTAFYKKRTKRERLIQRERLILIGTSLAVLVLFVDRMILGPVYSKVASLERQIRDEETAVKKSLLVLIDKERIIREGKEFMSFSVEAKNPEEEMTALLKEIQNIADKSSVALSYVKPGQVKSEKGIKKYTANLECESQMEQIASFFHTVESSNRLLKVEKFEIQPKNRESSIARCTMTISRTVLS
jgi:Tfp pilus assembly protein PilO